MFMYLVFMYLMFMCLMFMYMHTTVESMLVRLIST